MIDDIVINKIQSIQRCIQRAREEYHKADDFANDFSRQDAAILNITRACEQAIDLANHILKQYKLGIPNSSSDSFALLASQSIINNVLFEKLRRIIGFRNIAVHQYQALQLQIIQSIITTGLDDLLVFTDNIIAFVSAKSAGK
jgi:uncharacterized protein YutE (UPF0331/DUF86 family)